MKKTKLGLLALIVLVCTLAFASMGLAAEKNTILSYGNAKAELAPDMAYVDLRVHVKEATAEEARAAEAVAAEQVRRALLGLAITTDDLETTNYFLSQSYRDSKGKRVEDGFEAGSSIRVTVHDLSKLSKVVDATAGKGVSSIENVRFALSDKNVHQRALLAAAVENAKLKAAIVANAGGRELGSLLSAEITDYNAEAIAVNGARYKSSLMAADTGAPTQITPGKITATARVETVFALQ